MLWLKTWSVRGAFNHSAFMGKWLLLALSTQRMSYPSKKWGCGVNSRFHLVVFVIGLNQENWETGGAQDYQHQWWKASLQTFQPWIVIGQSRLLNCVYCFERRIQNWCIQCHFCWSGETKYSFCVCVAETVLLLLLSILLCILWW